MKERFLLVRPYYGVNIHTDAQGEYGTVLHSNDVFPDLPLINAGTVLNLSDDHEVRIIDAYAEDKMLPDELLKRIASEEYDKLIVKTTAASVKSDIELIRQIKANKPDGYVMAAGQAAKDLKVWLTENTPVDEVITEPLDIYIYRYVNGRDCTVNDLPTPDYSLVDFRKYTDDYNNVRLTIQAGRGCPMNCRYCPYIKYYEKYESREIDKVIEDIKAVVALGADIVQFRDQFFTCDKKKIRELCKRMITENIKVRWICETKLDSLDEDLIDLMKEAGMFLVCFGIESGDPEILQAYNSSKGDLERQIKTVRMINNKDILTMAFYMVGFPEDTWETLNETYLCAQAINSNIVAFNEYCEFNFKNTDKLDPSVFCSFENATNSGRKFNMTREEIRYVTDLFSAMYTAAHDCLEKAYTFNYKISSEYKNTVARIAECENDLEMLSNRIRRMK